MVSGGTTSTTITEARELAFRGFDAEIGFKLPTARLNWQNMELRFYAGGFLFENPDFDKTIAGPKLRLEWRIEDIISGWQGSRLTLETQYRWDAIRGDQAEGGVRLRLPFGSETSKGSPPQLTKQERRMTEGLHRDTDIVTQIKMKSVTTSGAASTTEKVEDALTGVDFDRGVVVANGTNLQTAINSAAANSLIIALGGPTSFEKVVLLPNQTVQGGGSVIEVRGLVTGLTVSFAASGQRPTIEHTANDAPVVTLVSNTHISGVTITGGGVGNDLGAANNHDVFANGASNVFITNVDISKVHGHGIFLPNGNMNINVVNTSISDVDFDGITFQSNNSISLVNASIHNSGDAIAGVSNNIISMNGVVISGVVREDVLDFLGTGNAVSGANNTISASSIGARLCDTVVGGLGDFSGTVSFTNGFIFKDNVAPCN